MNGANGDAHERSDFPSFTPAAAFAALPGPQFSAERVKELVAALEVPFDGSQIVWRVTNTSRDKSRGQVIPYADQRAYTDRLNALFTPAGWTRKYTIHTSANFERSRDQKTAAKVLVTCELNLVNGFLAGQTAPAESVHKKLAAARTRRRPCQSL